MPERKRLDDDGARTIATDVLNFIETRVPADDDRIDPREVVAVLMTALGIVAAVDARPGTTFEQIQAAMFGPEMVSVIRQVFEEQRAAPFVKYEREPASRLKKPSWRQRHQRRQEKKDDAS